MRNKIVEVLQGNRHKSIFSNLHFPVIRTGEEVERHLNSTLGQKEKKWEKKDGDRPLVEKVASLE